MRADDTRQKSFLKANPTDWLLEHENPSARDFTLRGILECPEKDPKVLEAKAAIKCYKKVSKTFKRQKPEGYWESAEQPCQPKYKSAYWQIMILGLLGLDKSDERVRKACEYIFQFQHEERGFTTFMEEAQRKSTNG